MGRVVYGSNESGNPGLATSVDSSYFLLKIIPNGGTTVYYSLGPFDVVYDGQTYTTNNQIRVVGSIQESYDPNGNEITIEWGTASISTNLITLLGLKKFNTQIILSIGSNGNFTKVYDGYVTSLTEVGSNTDRAIQIKCQSAFRNLDTVRNRIVTDIQAFDSKTLTWGTIVWQ